MEKKELSDYLKNLEELKNITGELKKINEALRPQKKTDWNTPLMYAVLAAGLIFALYFIQKMLIDIGL
ncbi:MAG: hypothetical protein N2594_07645 [Clostridiales bacterium]|nr:hypothetical protein [Clostridiales bacterium]